MSEHGSLHLKQRGRQHWVGTKCHIYLHLSIDTYICHERTHLEQRGCQHWVGAGGGAAGAGCDGLLRLSSSERRQCGEISAPASEARAHGGRRGQAVLWRMRDGRRAASRSVEARLIAPPSGIAPSGIAPSGINPSGISPSGINPSGIGASGMCPSSINPSGIAPSDIAPSDIAPSGIAPSGMCPSGIGASDIGPSGIGASGIGPSGIGASSIRSREVVGGECGAHAREVQQRWLSDGGGREQGRGGWRGSVVRGVRAELELDPDGQTVLDRVLGQHRDHHLDTNSDSPLQDIVSLCSADGSTHT